MTQQHTTAATGAAVFIAGLLEGVGIPWPGALTIAGAAAGMSNGLVAIPTMGLLFAAGYCLGSMVQYVLGRLVGMRVLSWLPKEQQGKVDGVMAKYGMGAVLWTRPLAAGNYVSLPAGMARMPVLRFLVYTLLGITPWSAGMASAGWLLGGQIDAVSSAIGRWLVPALLIFGLGLGLVKLGAYLLHQRHSRHEAEAAPMAA